MSLFRTKSWWQTRSGTDEEFDASSLCLANIDNNPDGKDKIITGSFQGYLRIYIPSEQNFKEGDMLLETPLNDAILQLEAGKLDSSESLLLVVLHPQKVTTFNVSAAHEAAYLELRKVQEIPLKHVAANMVVGAFGLSKRSDGICVQSLNGQLTFIEQDIKAFEVSLPDVLLPGPLNYLPSNDSFVTLNSSMDLECYQYMRLAAAAQQGSAEVEKGQKSRKPQCDWTAPLGELAIRSVVGYFVPGHSTSQVLVIGEHSLVVFDDCGNVLLRRQLGYDATAAGIYLGTIQKDTCNVLIASHTGYIMVYNSGQLLWNAKHEEVPVALCVGEFGGQRGLITTLTESGILSIFYLGTDPSSQVITEQAPHIDYEEVGREHARLMKVVNNMGSADEAQISSSLDLKVEVSRDADDRAGHEPSSALLRIQITNHEAEDVSELHLVLSLPSFLHCEQPRMVLELPAHTSTTVPVTCWQQSAMPSSTSVHVSAAYVDRRGVPCCTSAEVELPLHLLCRGSPPQQVARYRLVIDSNRPPPQLAVLFEDMVVEDSTMQKESTSRASALGFQFWSGELVSVLVSRNAGRYCVQSDAFYAMWLIVQELSRRLETYFLAAESGRKDSADRFRMSFEDSIPLQDFREMVDAHLAAQQAEAEACANLAKLSEQYRMAQKRLLTQFNDKNSYPLHHLDVLLEETFEQLLTQEANAEKYQEEICATGDRLSAGCKLLLQLVTLKFPPGDTATISLLDAYLSTEVSHVDGVSWEESVEASIAHLLKTVLAKNVRESAATIGLSKPSSAERLMKYLSLVLDRLNNTTTSK